MTEFARRKPKIHPVVTVTRVPRFLGFLLGSLMVASSVPSGRPTTIGFVILSGLIWPHLAHFLAVTSEDSRRAGYRNFKVDALLMGLYSGFTGFSPLPTSVTTICVQANNLTMGGLRLFFVNGAYFVLGMALSLPFTTFEPQLRPSLLTINLSVLLLAVFTWSIAFFVNGTTRRMIAARQMLRDKNRYIAEQARQLEEALDEISDINEVARVANSTLDLAKVIESVDRSLKNVFRFEQMGLLRLERDSPRLVLSDHVGTGIGADLLQRVGAFYIPLREETSSFVHAVQAGKPVYLPEISAEREALMSPSDRRLYRLSPLKSLLILPLLVQQEVIGVIFFGDTRNPFRLGDREIEKIERYVTQLVTGIRNARLFEEAELARAAAERLAKDLEVRNEFIRRTFGRYLSDEVVSSILESPQGLELGGEKKRVTLLMSDLRGFTAISERLGAETVMRMLNEYLGVMAEIILEHQGTIYEFIGDAILAVFGAPVTRDDDARRAVACALSMQRALREINRSFTAEGWPQVEMGVAIHTGTVVVGNIGSDKRAKYAVVGHTVNVTGRIESAAVGGQVLVSDTTAREVGEILSLGRRIEIQAKGASGPIVVHELLGVAGGYDLFLSGEIEILVPLGRELPIRVAGLRGKQVETESQEGQVTKLSAKQAEIRFPRRLERLSNIKMTLEDEGGPGANWVYAKVTEPLGDDLYRVRFTSVSAEAESRIGRVLEASRRP